MRSKNGENGKKRGKRSEDEDMDGVGKRRVRRDYLKFRISRQGCLEQNDIRLVRNR